MATIRERNGKLTVDFRYRGVRCREKTHLIDTPSNLKELQAVVKRMTAEITLETFNYADYFPKSARVAQFANHDQLLHQVVADTPTLAEFYDEWFDEHVPLWSTSHRHSIQHVYNRYIKPNFGEAILSEIRREHILKFRSELAAGKYSETPLRVSTIKKVINPLRQIVNEASLRFSFPNPYTQIPAMKMHRVDVNPFTLDEVKRIIANCRGDYKHYIAVRFFSGLRTSEINALRWKHIDFNNRHILVREGWVMGETTELKTKSSVREIVMSKAIYDALNAQKVITGKNRYVFGSEVDTPLDSSNFTRNVWRKLLAHLEIEYRRPYETRHTAATLMLASGESPDFIARQLGHSNTEMLFRVYTRYVPNLTRQDGSAFDKLITNKIEHGGV